MKFGKALQRGQVPEWADGYVDYKALKKRIATAANRKKQLGVAALTEDDPARAAFFDALDAEVAKVTAFFVAQQDDIQQRCREFAQFQQDPTAANADRSAATADVPDDATLVGESPVDAAQPEPEESGGGSEPEEIEEQEATLYAALDLKGELDELMGFRTLNLEGFRKILKKFDKRLKEQVLSIYTSHKITPTPLADPSILEELEGSIDKIVKTAHANVENRKAHEKEWKTYHF